MKPHIKHILQSQMDAGVSPSPKDKDVAQAFERYSEIQTGLSVSYDDLTYRELKLVSVIENVKNEIHQNKVQEAEQDAGRL